MFVMMQQFQYSVPCLFHLFVAVFRRCLQIAHLLFECFRLLDDHFQTIDHASIRDHGSDHSLKPCGAGLDVIIRLVDAKDMGASFVMSQCPVKTDDLASTSAMVVG